MRAPEPRHSAALLYVGLVIAGLLAGVLATLLAMGPTAATDANRPRVEVVELTARSGSAIRLPDSLISVETVDALRLNEAFKEVSARVTPAVVFIEVESSRGGGFFHRFDRGGFSVSAGSGVIISESGYVVTNYHVIEGADGIRVTLSDKREFDAEVVGEDPNTDLAVVRLLDADALPAVVLGDAQSVQVGEWVLAVGNPFRLTSTVTAGIVSALGRQVNIIANDLAIENFIQTDAAINPGNSGGALVNLRGELVGIATAIATESGSYEGYGFAVPVDLMQRVVRDLVESGEVERGYLGVTIEPVNADLAGELGLEQVRGVYLRDVRRGMASWEAGMRSGDVLVSIDGRDVDEPNELQGAIALYRPGDRVRATVWRQGQEIAMDVRLFGRNDARAREWFTELEQRRSGPDVSEPDNADGESPHGEVEAIEDWGIGLVDVSARIGAAFGVGEGAYIMFVEKDSPAEDAGMQRNSVIRSINGQPVASAMSVRERLERAEDSAVIEVVRRDGSSAFFEVAPPRTD